MFDEFTIRELCLRELTFLKAQQLYVTGAVEELREEEAEEPGAVYIEADVRGSGKNPYYVWLRYEEEAEQITDYSCECQAFQTYPGMCKHCAAVGLEYMEKHKSKKRLEVYRGLLAEARRMRTDRPILDAMQEYARKKRMREQEAAGNIELIPTLHEKGRNYYYGRKSYGVTFRIGPVDGKKYVIRNLETFVYAVQNEETYSYGKKLAFLHCKSMFTPEGWQYVQMIREGIAMRSVGGESIDKELPLNRVTMEQFLRLNLDRAVEYSCSGYSYDLLQIHDGNPPLKLSLREIAGGFQLVIPQLVLWRGSDHLFVRLQDQVYLCTQEYREAMEELLEYADEDRESVYRIAAGDMMSFCASVLPELESQGTVAAEVSLDQYRPKEVQISYFLDEEDQRVTLKAECSYGDRRFNLLEQPTAAEEYRDRMRERRALAAARAYLPYEDTELGILCFDSTEHDRMYRLLDTGIRQLEEEGTVYATDKIRAHSLIRSPKAQVGVSLESGLLKLTVSSDVFTEEELSEVMESYRKRKKYHRLRSGDFLNLENNAVSTVGELLDGLSLSAKQLAAGEIELPKFRACYIDQSLRKGGGQLRVDRDTHYRSVIREMKHVEDSDYRVPEGLAADLREYQKTGYRWLRTLAHLGFGGILADEMGLGKTLQTIAYLFARKKEGVSEAPSLIICPASLVYNWKKEIERFAPELSACVIVGTAAQRETLIREADGDVWITSYDMAKRDVELYRKLKFDTEVIDEAQNIKNQGTQAAKAVKQIHAAVRFALTGTPIENRLSELWSIFDYLMPGLLGTYEKFRKGYELPIMQEQDDSVSERLKRMVSPFILRRLKQEVLKELPEKLEQVVYARMEGEQRRLYMAHAKQLQESVAGKSREEIQKEKLQILAGLTRLRQLCCDPSLLYEDYEAEACKVDTCIELVKEAVGGRHKVLIFSQFTSMFPVLGRRLAEEGIAYYELTGQTPKEERQRLTEAFNSDEVPVFLISLKAGGTGLNLTAASIVIHFDPWWNLAAQNQATDRAHRIGQQNQVVVFRLIAQDTIEEKILDLQQRKQEMAGKILEGEGLAAAMLTKEDFMEILNF